jgi:hypothetical protein
MSAKKNPKGAPARKGTPKVKAKAAPRKRPAPRKGGSADRQALGPAPG